MTDDARMQNGNTPKASPTQLARLEALLFIHGEPLAVKKIAKTLGVGDAEAEALIKEFSDALLAEERGLALLATHGEVQLVTKSSFGDLLAGFMKEELSEDLTPAGIEALSIVAYLGPISRTKLEYLRGVNSSFTLRNLRLRGLVARMPDAAAPNSFLYDLTAECLKHLGAARREDLPEYEKFRTLLAQAGEGEAPPAGTPASA